MYSTVASDASLTEATGYLKRMYLNNCYLCGKKFIDIKLDQLKWSNITIKLKFIDYNYQYFNFCNDFSKKHDEHIIQQAIGGNLTENDILCSKCGGKLGKEIDEPFSKIFDGITTRLNIKKDRVGNTKSSSAKGKYINLKYKFMTLSWSIEPKKMTLFDFQYQYNQFCNEIGEIDVIWKDFKVFPLRPFHRYMENNRKVIIYSNQKNAKKYMKKVESEIAKKFKEDKKPEIIICDDLEGIIEYPFIMDNTAFKKGLAKTAIGFASKYGIKREHLPLVLDIENNLIKDKIPTIQFYPLGIIDKLIEIQKNEFEHYPFHNLILFTLDYDPKTSNGKKVLMCYIELFSTFQWYVILNEEYYGESIYEYYAQNILKKEDYIIELGRRYYKERNIWLQPLGITEEYIDKKYNNRKDKNKSRWDIEEELIQEETIKQKYKLDFEGYLYNIISGTSNQVLIFKDKEKFINLNTPLTEFLNKDNLVTEYDQFFNSIEDFMNFKQNLNLFFLQRYNDQYEDYDEIFRIFTYRIIYYEKDNYKNYYTELLEKYNILNRSGALRDYGYQKMNMLNNYIYIENIKHKNPTKPWREIVYPSGKTISQVSR